MCTIEQNVSVFGHMTIVFVNKIKTAQKVTESKLTNLVWSFVVLWVLHVRPLTLLGHNIAYRLSMCGRW